MLNLSITSKPSLVLHHYQCKKDRLVMITPELGALVTGGGIFAVWLLTGRPGCPGNPSNPSLPGKPSSPLIPGSPGSPWIPLVPKENLPL